MPTSTPKAFAEKQTPKYKHPCGLCTRWYFDKSARNKHLATHNPLRAPKSSFADHQTTEYKVPCGLCTRWYLTKSERDTHLNSSLHNTLREPIPTFADHETTEYKHPCELCPRWYLQEHELRRHLEGHEEREEREAQKEAKKAELPAALLAAIEAGQQLSRISRQVTSSVSSRFRHAELLANMFTQTSPEAALASQQVGEAPVLKKYMGTDQIPMYRCPICNNTGLWRKRTAHQDSHTLPYACPEESCEKRFAFANILRTHYLDRHTGQSFSCEECEATYTTASILKNHTCESNREKRRPTLPTTAKAAAFAGVAISPSESILYHKPATATSPNNEELDVADVELDIDPTEETSVLLASITPELEAAVYARNQRWLLFNSPIKIQAVTKSVGKSQDPGNKAVYLRTSTVLQRVWWT